MVIHAVLRHTIQGDADLCSRQDKVVQQVTLALSIVFHIIKLTEKPFQLINFNLSCRVQKSFSQKVKLLRHCCLYEAMTIEVYARAEPLINVPVSSA